MQAGRTIVEQARQLVEELVVLPPGSATLAEIAERLGEFARSPVWLANPFRKAAAGEELVYELAVRAGGHPSLYLVSDGAKVTSPPHCHGTWAIIVGIRGQELNHRYTLQSAEERTVARGSAVAVGPGQVLTLDRDAIHSTEVQGNSATFHLHLYGKALNELPSFQSRRFVVASP